MHKIERFVSAICLSIFVVTMFTACSKAKAAESSASSTSSKQTSSKTVTKEQQKILDQLAAETQKAAIEDGVAEPESSSAAPEPTSSSKAETSAAAQPAESIPSQSTSPSGTASKSSASSTPQQIPAEEQKRVGSLLSSISPEKLDLHTSLSNYELVFSSETEKINGKDYYNVQAVNAKSMRKEIMGMYFVATDQSAVFKYDLLSGKNISVDIS